MRLIVKKLDVDIYLRPAPEGANPCDPLVAMPPVLRDPTRQIAFAAALVYVLVGR